MHTIAYAGRDMQYHDHVTNVAGTWMPGKDVRIEGDRIFCTRDHGREYSFLDAFSRGAHIRFLSLTTDKEMEGFIETWGTPQGGRILEVENLVISSAVCWKYHAWLKALAILLQTILKHPSSKLLLVEDLASYKAADNNYWSSGTPLDINSYTYDLKHSPLVEVQQEVSAEIEASVESRTRLSVVWDRSKKPELITQWELNDLGEALQWMVMADFSRERPLTFCSECGTPFRPETAHKRKFCSYGCAHRVAVRVWRRKRARTEARGRKRR